MSLRRIAASTLAAVTLAAGLANPAAALPRRNFEPVNPTTIGAQCYNEGDTGQTVRIVRTYFDGSAGSWTVSNYNDEPIPVTRSVTESKTKNWSVSAGLNFDVLKLVNVSFNSSYSQSSSYTVGEVVGPYNIAPGKTAVLQAGWIISDFEGQRTVCRGGQWVANGGSFTAELPRERHVRVSTRDNESF